MGVLRIYGDQINEYQFEFGWLVTMVMNGM